MGNPRLLAAVLLVTACAQDVVTDELINQTGADLGAADELLAEHARAVADAVSLEDVRALEGALERDWAIAEADFLDDLDSLDGCDATEVGMDRLERMRFAFEGVADDVRAHLDVNRSVDTLTAAVQEELLLQEQVHDRLVAIDGERALLREDIRCVVDRPSDGEAAQ